MENQDRMHRIYEKPRLSSALKAIVNSTCPPFDVNRCYLDRHNHTEELEIKHDTSLKYGSDGFTWDKYLGSHEIRPQLPSSELLSIKKVFHEFLALIKNIVGEIEQPIAAIAQIIYEAGTDELKIHKSMYSIIKPIVGESLLQEDWIKIVELIRTLREWRIKHILCKRKLMRETIDKSDSLYGLSLPFEFPGKLIEVPDFLGSPLEDNQLPSDDIEEEELKIMDISPSWLVQQCNANASLNAHENVFLSGEDAARRIVEITRSSANEQQLQAGLFELLGETNIDLIGKVVMNSSVIKGFTFHSLTSQRDNQSSTSFKISLESEKKSKKQQRKREAKANKSNLEQPPQEEQDWLEAVGYDAEYLREIREIALHEAQMTGTSLVKQAFGQDIILEASESKRGLPEGTTRETFQGYEQVTIPAPKPKPMKSSDLIAINALEPFCQKLFVGIENLNRLQSELFEAAYRTAENLLVCAPTGAGKTNVAMLTIASEIRQRIQSNGTIDKSKLKIVYVAPMKALAQEVVTKFSKRLSTVNFRVGELTGDMQMTKKQIEETQIIVTTPEKWDVITRKSGDSSLLVEQVRLIIIDEVHLLADDRGAVIETLVARTLRLVETHQSMIRIVGLSATLPNYKDVAQFLRVNPKKGLFYFDGSYRPVPLEQTFIGVTEKSRLRQHQVMNQVVYDRVIDSIRRGHQVMVFVHSRKDTVDTIRVLKETACKEATLEEFSSQQNPDCHRFVYDVSKSRNASLREFFPNGFGIHHAGMLRSDRSLTERMFESGILKVLCCTATLAWGVNLPAHSVIIKGTQVYNAEKGGLMDLSMLDVMQIFGRAGRPQYDTSGEATMITLHSQLSRYLGLLTRQTPIESNFIKALPDHLNAEITSGTVVNLEEASIWLSYTYLYVRMMKNPMAYGITYEEKERDPLLTKKRENLLRNAAHELQECRMVRLDESSGNLGITNWGRVASHFYVHHKSVRTFNEMLQSDLTYSQLFCTIASSAEFEQLQIRDDEIAELEQLKRKFCPFLKQQHSAIGEQLQQLDKTANSCDKANILLQAYISNARINGFSLISDTNYVAQNASRVTRALFEVSLRKNWPRTADQLLSITKTIDKRIWWEQTPLRQLPNLDFEVLSKIEDKRATLDDLIDMEPQEIGQLIRNMKVGVKIAKAIKTLPWLDIQTNVQPVTRSVLRVTIDLIADFVWSDHLHGTIQPWWIWIEDTTAEHLYHSEYFLLHKKKANEPHQLVFTIPIFEPIPSQYILKATSDIWVGIQIICPISFQHLILPTHQTPQTDLLDLRPLPREALHNKEYEDLYSFSHFNPIQTQIFHVMYHTDTNILLGAPTGSGKTIAAEIAIFRLWNTRPKAKTVYIAPLKALSRERVKDWKNKFGNKRNIVELTGDSLPDQRAIKSADILVTTPEKWDGITRGWRVRNYVQDVELLIIDEIHLLGEDRGPVLEVIVSRMQYIAFETKKHCRIVGLSTALANAQDLAAWLSINNEGMFNFRPSVRPIPMEVHIQGFPGKHYCPRMATMNKPAYAAIQVYSPSKPVLIFVSSRRQTRITALDLISHCASESSHPKHFLHMNEEDMDSIVLTVQDSALKHTLAFGVGVHHAGLNSRDRDLVEELFCNGKIQVLICTSTLAWGVNFPAHLVIIKGTEYYDGKTSRYVDFPITDVLQMMGRAGRPQYDTKGVACIFVHEPKKNFYKRFLYQPFPIESALIGKLHNHINAEVAGGSIRTKKDGVDYLKWTFLYRRLLMNPTYYDLHETSNEGVERFLFYLADSTLEDLRKAECVIIDGEVISSTELGKICSFYYLEYSTVSLISNTLKTIKENEQEGELVIKELVKLLANCHEFNELPVRHNEELLNEKLSLQVPWETDGMDFECPHTKAYLLLQAHLAHVPLPMSDYVNDTKSMLDQVFRILNAIIEIAAKEKKLLLLFAAIKLSQMLYQARLSTDYELLQLPLKLHQVESLYHLGIRTIKNAIENQRKVLSFVEKQKESNQDNRKRLENVLKDLPQYTCTAKILSNKVILSIKFINFKSQLKVYTQSDVKAREYGFWLILVQENEFLSMKRIQSSKRFIEVSLEYKRLKELSMELFIFSDSILGLDQRIELKEELEERKKDSTD